MGKRKSARKVTVKKREKLDVQFDCPYCNESKSTEYKADKKMNVGTVYCRICFATFSMSINSLSAAVDVYSGWIDHIESNPSGSRPGDDRDASFSRDKGAPPVVDDLFGDLDDEDVSAYTETNRHGEEDDYDESGSIRENDDELFGSDSEPELEPPRSKHSRVADYISDDEPTSTRPAMKSYRSRIQSDDSDSEHAPRSKGPRHVGVIVSDEDD